MAELLKTDGSRETVHPNDGKQFTLKELQGFVGGYVECIELGERIMWLNEDGKYSGLARNEAATRLAVVGGIADGDFIVGDVLITIHSETRSEEAAADF